MEPPQPTMQGPILFMFLVELDTIRRFLVSRHLKFIYEYSL